MDQFTEDLKKVLKAGMGAVATGLEKGSEALETLAKKGEPLYEQAKTAVADAAGKVRQAVNESMKIGPQEIIDALRNMSREEWAQIRQALDEFEAQADEGDKAAKEAAEAAQDILNRQSPDLEDPCPFSGDTEKPEEPQE